MQRLGNVLTILVVLTLVLSGCGGGGGGSSTQASTPTPETYSLEGQIQKGPFAIGSQISVNELDSNLNPVGSVYNIQTVDDLGNFSVSTKIRSRYVEIIGDGFYMDELTGQLSSSRTQLRAIADLKTGTKVSVNILTAIQALRLKKLVSQGTTFAAASTRSQNEVLSALGVDPTKVTGLSNLVTMKINGTNDSDSVLLALSSILSRMASNQATAKATSQPTELSSYINTIASQIQNTGILSSTAITNARNLATTQIDLAAVRTNVETYYADRGVTIVAPKFEEWVDKDALGILPRRLVPVTGLAFTNAAEVEPNQLITSNTIIVAGLGSGVAATISVNSGTTIIKNGAAVTGTISAVVNGDTIALQVTSLGYGLTHTATISAGISSATWQVTSKNAPLPILVGLFAATGNLINARQEHTSTLLPSGQVLITGGHNGIPSLASAELYDQATGIFSSTGSMGVERYGHTATLLSNGKVLIAGGITSSMNGITLATAEIYDPVTGLFSATGSMTTARIHHTATLLLDGKVLIAGGSGAGGSVGQGEIFDPTSGTFSPTGNMAVAKRAHTATRLVDGRVLITGGQNGATFLQSAEIYDPATGLFSLTGTMSVGRVSHTATLLLNGKVLITGGFGGTGSAAIYNSSAELYDPASASFVGTGNMSSPRWLHAATLLANGQVLVSGGRNGAYLSNALVMVDLYDPATGLFSTTGSMLTARQYHSATLLPSGRVLVSGGFNGGTNAISSAEIYQ